MVLKKDLSLHRKTCKTLFSPLTSNLLADAVLRLGVAVESEASVVPIGKRIQKLYILKECS